MAGTTFERRLSLSFPYKDLFIQITWSPPGSLLICLLRESDPFFQYSATISPEDYAKHYQREQGLLIAFDEFYAQLVHLLQQSESKIQPVISLQRIGEVNSALLDLKQQGAFKAISLVSIAMKEESLDTVKERISLLIGELQRERDASNAKLQLVGAQDMVPAKAFNERCKETAKLQRECADKTVRLSELEVSCRGLQEEVERLRSDCSALRQMLQEGEKQRSPLVSQCSLLNSKAEELRRLLEAESAARQTAEVDAGEAKISLKQLRHELHSTQRSLKAAQQRLSDVQLECDERERELIRLRQQESDRSESLAKLDLLKNENQQQAQILEFLQRKTLLPPIPVAPAVAPIPEPRRALCLAPDTPPQQKNTPSTPSSRHIVL